MAQGSEPETPRGARDAQYALNLTLAGFAGQVGCITLAIVIAAVLGGLYLDRTLNTRPLFTILLLLGSVPITIIVMYRVAMGAIRQIKPTAPAKPRQETINSDRDS